MRRGVDTARAAADDRHTDIRQLIRQPAGRLQAVVRRPPRANHRDGIFVLHRHSAFDVEHNRRIVNLSQQFGIVLVGLRQDVATEFLNALQLGAQVNRLLPVRDRLRGFPADTAHLEQLLFGRPENGGRIAKMFEQLPHADRADVLDQVQADERFPGIHIAAN